MKKTLSLFICLALALSLFMVPAQATQANVSIHCADTCQAGESITVELRAADITDCCAISLLLEYDPSLLEVTQVVRGTAFSGGLSEINPTFTENQVFMSFTGSMPQDISGALATVTFSVKSSAKGTATFAIRDLRAYDVDSDRISVSSDTIKNSSILTGAGAVLKAIPVPTTDGTVCLQFWLEQATDYCGISFRLRYDSARYKVLSMSAGSDFAGEMFTTNPNAGTDEVFASMACIAPTSRSGHLLNVVLQPLDGQNDAADFSFSSLKLRDASGSPLEISPMVLTGSLQVQAGSDALTVSANLINLASTELKGHVMFALYSTEGQMLCTQTAQQTVAAGHVETFYASLPNRSDGAFVRAFFLSENYVPICSAAQHSLAAAA